MGIGNIQNKRFFLSLSFCILIEHDQFEPLTTSRNRSGSLKTEQIEPILVPGKWRIALVYTTRVCNRSCRCEWSNTRERLIMVLIYGTRDIREIVRYET